MATSPPRLSDRVLVTAQRPKARNPLAQRPALLLCTGCDFFRMFHAIPIRLRHQVRQLRYLHDGLRASGDAILPRLWGMADGTGPLPGV